MGNETIRCLAVKRLKERAKKIDPEHGTSLNNIYKIGLDASVINDIKDCLESKCNIDVSKGLYFLMGLLQHYKLAQFGDEFIIYLKNKIPTLITQEPKGQSSYFALDCYILLRNNYPDYRKKMLDLLNSTDLGYRKKALEHYETYCNPREIEPLLIFKNDSYSTELSMCGPLVFELRNLALEKICKALKKNFILTKKYEYQEKWNDDVSWNDWEPFLEWWNKEKNK